MLKFVKKIFYQQKMVKFIIFKIKLDIETEKIESRAFVKDFDKGNLKKVHTEEKNPLPTLQNIRGELLPDILPTKVELEQLRTFVKNYLNHVETRIKDTLPTSEG